MRPQVPEQAERARTIAARASAASLVLATDDSARTTPHLHFVHADGTATVLLPDGAPLVVAAVQAPSHAITAMLELTDTAPVSLREPVRGLLWLTGALTVLREDAARERVVAVAEHRADPRLLDAGHGVTVLRMDPTSLVLADGDGSGSLDVADFEAASPDPFHDFENGWLRHLELSHRDVVGALSRHLPVRLRGGQVRPLGLDRWGLRLRVEAADADHDVRLGFAHPVSTPQQLSVELRRLVGCPFLAGARQ